MLFSFPIRYVFPLIILTLSVKFWIFLGGVIYISHKNCSRVCYLFLAMATGISHYIPSSFSYGNAADFHKMRLALIQPFLKPLVLSFVEKYWEKHSWEERFCIIYKIQSHPYITQCPLYERWDISMSSASLILETLFPSISGQPCNSSCGQQLLPRILFPCLLGVPVPALGPFGLVSQFRAFL